MNKNRGFTLIEVLATLIILSIVALIITPIVSELIKGTRESISKEQKEIILRSAKKWAVANMDLLPQIDNASCILTLEQLKKSGYYENKDTVVDPEIDGPMNGVIYLTYTEISYDYKVEYFASYQGGDTSSMGARHCKGSSSPTA